MKRARRRIAVLVGVGVLVAGAVLTFKYGRHHVLARRFAVVEAGQLYRSGYLEPWPLERVIREHRLKTLLVLMSDEPDSPRQQEEEAIARREVVRIVRIAMPGDGCGDFDLLDWAADTIAEESNRPLLVHCVAGVNRTGAAYAAWRMKYCGWDVDQALAEAQAHGVDPESRLVEHLRGYYRFRVLRNRSTDHLGSDGSLKSNSTPTTNPLSALRHRRTVARP